MASVPMITQCVEFLAAHPILGRLFLGSIELAALAFAVVLLIRVTRIKSPRACALLWLLVLSKPIISLLIGSPLPLLRFPAPQQSPPIQNAINDIGGNADFDQPTRELRPLEKPTAVVVKDTRENPIQSKQDFSVVGTSKEEPASSPSQNRLFSTGYLLILFWASGVIFFTGLTIQNFRHVRSIREESGVPDENLSRHFAKLAREMGLRRIPALGLTHALESPALVGIFRPAVLLPYWLIEKHSNLAGLDWLLRHELTHWRLHDAPAFLIRRIAEILFFFHPVIWWAGRQWEEAMELACDRALLASEADAHNYAQELYRVLEAQWSRRRIALGSGLFATRTQIGRRIAALLTNPLRFPAQLSFTSITLTAIFGWLTVLAGFGFQRPLQPLMKSAFLPELAGAKWYSTAFGFQRYAMQCFVFDKKIWVTTGQEVRNSGTRFTDNSVWNSTNGKIWNLATSAAKFRPRSGACSLIFDNQIWIFSGSPLMLDEGSGHSESLNDVFCSSDGIQYTTVTTEAAFPARFLAGAVVFHNRMWIFGGCKGGLFDPAYMLNDVWSSADGLTWTKEVDHAAFGPRCEFMTAVYHGRIYVIGGYDAKANKSGWRKRDVWSSADGKNWVLETTSVPWNGRDQGQLIVFDNKLWLIAGVDNNSATNEIWSSTDGKDWTLETLHAAFPARGLFGIANLNDEFFILGGFHGNDPFTGYSRNNDIWHSTDCVHWSLITQSPDWDGREGLAALQVNDTTYVIGGRQGTTYKNDVFSSNDLINWYRLGGAPFTGRFDHTALSFNGKLWVIGGKSRDGFLNDVWSSVNGSNWIRATDHAAFSPRAGHSSFVLNHKIWVLGGENSSQKYNDIWSSSDGITWTKEIASAAFAPRAHHALAQMGNQIYLIGGAGEKNLLFNDVWSSIDGRSWAQKTSAPSPFPARRDHLLYAVSGRLWLIAGRDGNKSYADVWSSANGMAWTQTVQSAEFAGCYNAAAVARNDALWLLGGFDLAEENNSAWFTSLSNATHQEATPKE